MGTVTLWIVQVRRGDDLAAAKLWERYFEELVRQARWRLGGRCRTLADEEDIAATAFEEFFRAARRGRYPDLTDRGGLWRLLLCITARRAADLKKKTWRQRQKVQGESALPSWDSEKGLQALDEVLGDTPSPEVIVASMEKCRELLERLGDSSLQQIAIARLEGYTNQEIGRRLDCSLRTVERKLNLIRKVWKHELDQTRRVRSCHC